MTPKLDVFRALGVKVHSYELTNSSKKGYETKLAMILTNH
jgi:hypothetical protein